MAAGIKKLLACNWGGEGFRISCLEEARRARSPGIATGYSACPCLGFKYGYHSHLDREAVSKDNVVNCWRREGCKFESRYAKGAAEAS